MVLYDVGLGIVDWIDLIKDRNWWRVSTNAVVNHLVPHNAGNFLTSSRTQKGLHSMGLGRICHEALRFVVFSSLLFFLLPGSKNFTQHSFDCLI